MTGPEAESMRLAMLESLPVEIVDQMRETGSFVDELIWQGTFGGRFADQDYAIRIFNEHTAAVIAAVPTERLLVYEVKEGWAPLCRFLDLAVPKDEPFPHVNDSASFEAMRTDPEAIRQRVAAMLEQ
jgi:hypothetical protein